MCGLGWGRCVYRLRENLHTVLYKSLRTGFMEVEILNRVLGVEYVKNGVGWTPVVRRRRKMS